MSIPADTPQPEQDASARDLLRLGVVQSVDLAAARCVMDLGDGLVIGPIPWAAARAGATKIWAPPSVGEQLLVFAPEGDLERAIAGPAIFTTAFGPPATDARFHIEFSDGAHIAYNPGDGLLEVEVMGRVFISAPDGVGIQGDVSIEGDVAVTGKIDATGDVKSDTVSLHEHLHIGVTAGGGISGKPKL